MGRIYIYDYSPETAKMYQMPTIFFFCWEYKYVILYIYIVDLCTIYVYLYIWCDNRRYGGRHSDIKCFTQDSSVIGQWINRQHAGIEHRFGSEHEYGRRKGKQTSQRTNEIMVPSYDSKILYPYPLYFYYYDLDGAFFPFSRSEVYKLFLYFSMDFR